MNILLQPMQKENGNTLFVVVLVMIVLALIGFSAISSTTTDLNITGNDKFHKMAFYSADSGVFTTPKLISKTIDAAELLTGSEKGNISYLARPSGDTSDFHRQIFGFDAYDDGFPDIEYTLGDHTVQVDAGPAGKKLLAGGGVEFASGAEGVGVGSMGGILLFFDMNSTGDGPSNAFVRIAGGYRKVMGMPGGL